MRKHATMKCAQTFVIDSEVSIDYLEDEPLTQNRVSNDPIQLRPQHVSLTNVRIGKNIGGIYWKPIIMGGTLQGKGTRFRLSSSKLKITQSTCIS